MIINRLINITLIILLIFACIPTNSVYGSESVSEEKVWEMTSMCWNLRERNPDSAVIIGLEAKRIAEENNYIDILPQINGFLGVIFFHYLYDLKSALPYLQESLERSMEVNDSTRLAYSYNNLGDVYMMSGNIPIALDYSQKSIRIFELLNNQKGIAYGYINLGLIYDEEGKYEKAETYFRKALEIRKKLGDTTGYASALYQLARSQQHKGELEEAMENFQRSYEYHKEINNLSYTAYCLNGMATINYLKGDLNKSLEQYIQAIELHQRKGHPFGLIEDYLGIAMVYAELGNIYEGKEALKKALHMSSSLEMHPKVLETYKVYADFYQSLDNKEAALESLKKFVQLYDSILFLQQEGVIEEVERMNQTQRSLQLAQQELETKAMERMYLQVIIFLMVILVIVFIWRILTQSKMNRRLRIANTTKDKLFSVVSHDLRSPFNTILGFSSLLKESIEKNDPDSKKYADAVYQQSSETLSLIDNLLTWSRAQSNRIEFNPQSVLIDSLFSQLESSFDYLANVNKINLSFNNSTLREVNLDKNIIMIVISNLISNSLKYTPEEGSISVSAKETEKSIQFTIEDSGIGISPEKLKKLYSNENVDSRKGLRNEGGTGLGLSICRDLLQLHKGGMNIESEIGKGTKFTITIPNF